jgi:hypothetical protein
MLRLGVNNCVVKRFFTLGYYITGKFHSPPLKFIQISYIPPLVLQKHLPPLIDTLKLWLEKEIK